MQSPSKTFEDLEKLCDEAAAAFGEGRFKKARGLYLDALRTCDEIMDDGYRISIREYLGVSCYRLESFTEAEQHDRKTLQLLASRNDSDPKVITLRHNLARDLSAIHDRDLLKKLDKLEEAIVLHRQNLEVPQTSGKRRDQLLETKYSLAFDLAKLSKSSLDTEVARGLLEEAASLDEQVLQAREQKKPKDPLTVRLTIESRHNFASVLYRQKKYSKAKELFLQNLKDLDTLSSTERKDIGALLQSTDRHLAACCEATKDISLSIARITTESKKSYKQKRGAKEREELPSDLSNWKESGGAKKEPDGKLWQLSVESTNTNRKIKTTPAGLDTSLTHLSIEAPVNGGIVTTPAWSDIAASGNAQIQNGNVYANTIINNYNYATATPAAMNQSLGGQVAVPQPIFTVEAPLPEDNAIRRSRSQGHGSRSDSSLHPASALRPRSASSVPADDLSVEVPKTRSRSVSQPQKRTEKPSAKAKANRRRSTSSAGPSSDANIESSASISSSGESRNRQKEKTGSRRIQQNSLLKPEHLNRSRTRSSTGPVKSKLYLKIECFQQEANKTKNQQSRTAPTSGF
jgi:tetratricopeptide (TPR) repeat protein